MTDDIKVPHADHAITIDTDTDTVRRTVDAAYARYAAINVDATRPVGEVVDEILRVTGLDS